MWWRMDMIFVSLEAGNAIVSFLRKKHYSLWITLLAVSHPVILQMSFSTLFFTEMLITPGKRRILPGLKNTVMSTTDSDFLFRKTLSHQNHFGRPAQNFLYWWFTQRHD